MWRPRSEGDALDAGSPHTGLLGRCRVPSVALTRERRPTSGPGEGEGTGTGTETDAG